MNVTKTQIAAAAAAVVSAASHKKDISHKAGQVTKSAVSAVREYATITQAAGISPQAAADYLVASWKDTSQPVGTIKPYVASLKGYRQAMVEGVDITDTRTDKTEGEAKPMTAPAARAFLLSKEEREVKAALDTVREEIGKRARGCKSLSDLIAVRDLLPEVKGTARTVSPEEMTADELLDSLLPQDVEADDAEQKARAA